MHADENFEQPVEIYRRRKPLRGIIAAAGALTALFIILAAAKKRPTSEGEGAKA